MIELREESSPRGHFVHYVSQSRLQQIFSEFVHSHFSSAAAAAANNISSLSFTASQETFSSLNHEDFKKPPSDFISHKNSPPFLFSISAPSSDKDIFFDNSSSNGGSGSGKMIATVIQLALFGSIILLTLLGNILVLVTIYKRTSLHNMSMFLVACLSISDLMVAFVVMPIKVLYQLTDTSILPYCVCLMWVFADIFFCTSSILTLCMIGLDRYWIMRGKVTYIYYSNFRKILYMICPVYVSAALIALPSVVFNLVEQQSPSSGNCQISQNLIFTLYSTIGAFYLPFVILVVIYMKIYKYAKIRWKRSYHRENNQPSRTAAVKSTAHSSNNGCEQNGKLAPVSSMSKASFEMQAEARRCDRKNRVNNNQFLTASIQTQICLQVELKKRQKLHKREVRAITTVFVILSTFVVCWFPFFVLAVLVPFCGSKCQPPDPVRLSIDWLGYVNSTLNPIIYAVFNLDFRKELKATLSFRR